MTVKVKYFLSVSSTNIKGEVTVKFINDYYREVVTYLTFKKEIFSSKSIRNRKWLKQRILIILSTYDFIY